MKTHILEAGQFIEANLSNISLFTGICQKKTIKSTDDNDLHLNYFKWSFKIMFLYKIGEEITLNNVSQKSRLNVI